MRKTIAAVAFVLAVFFFAMGFVNILGNINERPNYQVVTIVTPLPPPEPPPEGWSGLIAEPAIFTTEELERMLELAPHYTETRPSRPHPSRRMTSTELTAWIEDYNIRGGINAQELELLKIINDIREGHNLPPFTLCPRLSMAARLFSYLQVKYHTAGHTDNYYGDLMVRSNFFGAYGRLYMENANSQRWRVLLNGQVEYIYMSPQELVDGWMSSDDHRDHILTIETTHVGFGVDSGRNRVVPTMKSIMPR
ncbi:MAG: CAP domain-containing protein [Defluviitaleaceae bacterium]|nr:CAP domain-containing protein [Defluviitaleaceae bacterium]